MQEKYRISVCTPTFNRESLLTRLYESLCRQTFTGFEWLVIDDGSNDNTKDRVHHWQQTAPFPIRYYYQQNQGRFTALNHGFAEAVGELIVFDDSDDYFLPNALERMLYHWDTISINEKQHFAGVAGLCMDKIGNLIGTKFPKNTMDSTPFDLKAHCQVKGDKTYCYRSDILKANPFPIFEGEKRIPPSILFNRLGRYYKTRFVNEIWTAKEYLPDGITKNIKRWELDNPRSEHLFYEEILKYQPNIPIKRKFRTAVHYVRFSMHCGISLYEQMRNCGTLMCWVMALPFAVNLYFTDRRMMASKRR
jgi:glycosyltransferase involved in cell wall biosynthesis